MSKIYIISLLVFIAVSVILGVGVQTLLAQDSYRVTKGGGSEEIDAWDECRVVTNNNANNDIFVPVKTEKEWLDFRVNASSVELDDCSASCTNDGYTCSSNSDCCSGYCYVDADGDRYAPSSGTKRCQSASQYSGTDCCDIDANAFPGWTRSYSSTNECGSWDYNCNGVIDKDEDVCFGYRTYSLSDYREGYRIGCNIYLWCQVAEVAGYQTCTLSDHWEWGCGEDTPDEAHCKYAGTAYDGKGREHEACGGSEPPCAEGEDEWKYYDGYLWATTCTCR